MPISEDLAILITEYAHNLSHAESLTAGLSRAQFNWRAQPGTWSIAQCISHLNVLNGKEIGPITAAIDAATAKGFRSDGPFRYGFISRYLMKMFEPPVKRKFKAPPPYTPPPESDPAETLAEYRRINSALTDLMRRSNGLDLARVKTIFPELKFLRMALGARFVLLASHDRRHLWQADNIRQNPAFPAQ